MFAWTATEPSVLSLATWSEQRPGRGEDAAPTHIFYAPSHRGFAAVYDGLGGAGAATLCHRQDGTPLTEAYIASRMTRLIVERWFAESLAAPPRGPDGSDDGARADANGGAVPGTDVGGTDRLGEDLRDGLRSVANPNRSRVAGSLRRQLPTTLASVEYQLEADKTISLRLRWVGDSRVYLLQDPTGLQQLTLDDTHETDALKLLLNSPPMSNVISADRRFRIQYAQLRLPAPAVLICATDGYHGYVASPAHFEHLIYSAIMASQDLDGCARRLAEAAAAITGDDASIVMVAIGFDDWRGVQEVHRPRAGYVEQQFIEPLLRAEHDAEEYAHVREDAWSRYRVDYEALLPAPASGAVGKEARA